MKIKITLNGIKPLLMRNGRLANPQDFYTRKLKELTKKRNKTDEDLVDIMMVEARGSCYETDDGFLAMPTANVWRSFYDAAKAFKLGQDIKRSLIFEDTHEPLFLGGKRKKKVKCETLLSNPENISYRPVKIGMSRIMRSRPLIPKEWQSSHEFELLTDVIDPHQMKPILERAGRLIGILDYRPIYGTFTAEMN